MFHRMGWDTCLTTTQNSLATLTCIDLVPLSLKFHLQNIFVPFSLLKRETQLYSEMEEFKKQAGLFIHFTMFYISRLTDSRTLIFLFDFDSMEKILICVVQD